MERLHRFTVFAFAAILLCRCHHLFIVHSRVNATGGRGGHSPSTTAPNLSSARKTSQTGGRPRGAYTRASKAQRKRWAGGQSPSTTAPNKSSARRKSPRVRRPRGATSANFDIPLTAIPGPPGNNTVQSTDDTGGESPSAIGLGNGPRRSHRRATLRSHPAHLPSASKPHYPSTTGGRGAEAHRPPF